MKIAARTLHIQTDAIPTPVQIVVNAPVSDNGAWACEFVIGWPEGDFTFRAMGLDAVQALSIALGRIAYQLYMSPHHAAGTLYFERPGTGYGFRLPSHIRHLAIGDDRDL